MNLKNKFYLYYLETEEGVHKTFKPPNSPIDLIVRPTHHRKQRGAMCHKRSGFVLFFAVQISTVKTWLDHPIFGKNCLILSLNCPQRKQHS